MLEFAFGRILFVKADPDKPQVNEERAKTLFQEIQKLKSDREISEFITKNTDEIQRKAIGGRLEPHCINCGNDPFTSILKEAAQNKGTFILKQPSDPDPSIPKQTAKDYYIIKVERIEKIYPKKIDKFFQNELDKLKTLALKYVSKEGITEEEKTLLNFIPN